MPTTKQKLEFAMQMARSTRASVRQVQALMRLAGALRAMAELDAKEGQRANRNCRRERIQRKVTELCAGIILEYTKHTQNVMSRFEKNTEGLPWEQYRIKYDSCSPIFTGPQIKIRIPSGEEIVCPS